MSTLTTMPVAQSAQKVVKPEARRCVAEFKRLWRQAQGHAKMLNADLWLIGDCIRRLRDKFGYELKEIKQLVDNAWSLPRLSQLCSTARAFPPDQRRDDATFYQHEMARKAATYELNGRRYCPAQVLDVIVKNDLRSMKRVSRFLAKLAADESAEQSRRSSSIWRQRQAQLVNNCHHCRWEEIVANIPDASLNCIVADPPYFQGGYFRERPPGNGLLYECDNANPEAALDTTLALFDVCYPKMVAGGALLVFAPGGTADDPRLLNQAQKAGWECAHVLTWIKTSDPVRRVWTPPPTDFQGAYAPTTEKILVFARRGEHLPDHSRDQDRRDVLFFDDVVRYAARRMLSGKIPVGTVHVHEKPVDLCLHLIGKHVPPGGLLFEPFGCTGSACRAAILAGDRRWAYCESNRRNFDNGSARIAAQLAAASTHM